MTPGNKDRTTSEATRFLPELGSGFAATFAINERTKRTAETVTRMIARIHHENGTLQTVSVLVVHWLPF